MSSTGSSTAMESLLQEIDALNAKHLRKQQQIASEQTLRDFMNPEKHLIRVRAERLEKEKKRNRKKKVTPRVFEEIIAPAPAPPPKKKVVKPEPVKEEYVYVPKMNDSIRAMLRKMRHPAYIRPTPRGRSKPPRRRLPMSPQHLRPQRPGSMLPHLPGAAQRPHTAEASTKAWNNRPKTSNNRPQTSNNQKTGRRSTPAQQPEQTQTSVSCPPVKLDNKQPQETAAPTPEAPTAEAPTAEAPTGDLTTSLPSPDS